MGTSVFGHCYAVSRDTACVERYLNMYLNMYLNLKQKAVSALGRACACAVVVLVVCSI